MRAKAFCDELQQRYDPVRPSLATDDFTDLIRQSFSLEIDQFFLELMEVIQGSAMSPVRVWMALLLGGFRLESQGEFYEGAVVG